jgi:hypothetical protein
MTWLGCSPKKDCRAMDGVSFCRGAEMANHGIMLDKTCKNVALKISILATLTTNFVFSITVCLVENSMGPKNQFLRYWVYQSYMNEKKFLML